MLHPLIFLLLLFLVALFLGFLAFGAGAAAVLHTLILAKPGVGAGMIGESPPPRSPWDWWDILWSTGCPPKMNLEPDGTYTFPFPKAPGSVHYINTTAPPVTLGQTVEMVFATEGTGTIVPAPGTGDPPARLRLYLEQKNATVFMAEKDDTKVVEHEMERWWSVETAVISSVPGSFTLKINLSPVLWSSVYGRAGDNPLCGDGFANCLANLGKVGFTFGGMFAGHGDVLQDGEATFRLVSYKIN